MTIYILEHFHNQQDSQLHEKTIERTEPENCHVFLSHGVVTHTSPVEVFVTGIEMQSSDQHSF